MRIVNRFIKKLSQLTIDVDKDWGGRRITNIGAPAADTDAPRARAGDILSGRFGMARMPDGLSGLVLSGQGAGVDPAYVPGVQIVNGSYTGDGTDGRQITVGFACKFVFVMLQGYTNQEIGSWACQAAGNSFQHNYSSGSYGITSDALLLHASDGFVVKASPSVGLGLNANGSVYEYAAIG